MAQYSWTCPFCQRIATINSDRDTQRNSAVLCISNAEGPRGFWYTFVVCPNDKCRRFTLSAGLIELATRDPRALYSPIADINMWRLYTAS
jgi:hypothetical protein